MKLVTVKNAVTSRVARQILVGQKHSPTIMFAGGVVGVVATTVLACRATLKLDEILTESEKNHTIADEIVSPRYSENDRKHDHAIIKVRTAKNIALAYAPAVGVGVLSIGALTGSHVTLNRRNAAMMAAYSALDKGFNEYRARVREEYGEDKEREIRHNVTTETVDIHDTKKGTVTQKKISVPGDASIYARYFDECSSSWERYPEHNLIFLKCQQNYANDKLHARGHIFLNEVYDMLGIDHSKAGAVVGWVMGQEGDSYIDFGIFDGDRAKTRDFVNGREGSILLDFNVDGVIYDLIEGRR